MRRSMLARLAAMTLAASMMFTLTACGDSDSSSKSKSDEKTSSAAAEDESTPGDEESKSGEEGNVTGEVKQWGIYSVLIPEGWTLRTGDVLDDNDENYCSVKKSDFSYFDFKCETEDVQKMQYNYNKNTYTLNQADLPETEIASIKWNGFEYGNDFTKGFELYGSSNGRFLRVSGVGFAFDSAEAKAVLGSLKVTEAPADSSSEADDSSAEERQPETPENASLMEKFAVKYNGVTFSVGDKFGNIKDLMGEQAKPSKMMQPCVPDSQEVELVYYPGMTIQVNYEDTIISVSITEEECPGRDVSIACGLRLGDDRETAKRFLGEGEEDEYGITYKSGSMMYQVMDREKDGIFLISAYDNDLPF